ncbi:MAG TPA: hypothetical protein VKT75_09965 [Acidobacteriaceae bacterium]|nr:hypothetical protein [Acidobacteriaceae bacterium]
MKQFQRRLALCSAVAAILLSLPVRGSAQANGATTVLHASEAAKLLPDAVYYDGKSASTQLRNSAGVHFADGAYALAVLVDTSGYSSEVQQKYQGYLLTETSLEFGTHRLSPGAYGFGFVAGRFVITDIGAHDVFEAEGSRESQMARPVPLQIIESSSGHGFQLCSGRDCVAFHRGAPPAR